MTVHSHATKLLCGIVLTAGAIAMVSAQEPEARIWTDKTGKHEIRAKFVDVTDGQARLERPNGDITRVPLAKLSQADRDYIRDLAKGSKAGRPAPAETADGRVRVGSRVEVDHFSEWRLATVVEIDHEWDAVRVTIDGERGFPRRMSLDEIRDPETKQPLELGKPEPPAGALKTVRPDYDDMARPVGGGAATNRIAADPLPADEADWTPEAVRLGAVTLRDDNFLRAIDLAVVTGQKRLAAVLYESHGFDEVPFELAVIDLDKRKLGFRGQVPHGSSKVALSPAGTGIATAQSEHHGPDSTGQVDFWKYGDGKPSHWTSFVPYENYSWPKLDPEWIAWLDDKRLFTANSDGRIILWQVDGAKAVYEIVADSRAEPVLTPGRKFLAVPTDAGVQFYDADNGELKAVVGSGSYQGAKLAFSPSGKQLAITSSDFIDVLDVTTGETVRSFPCKDLTTWKPAAWIDEEYLFAPGGLVINVPLRVVAWKLDMGQELVKSAAKTHWALLGNSREDQMLVPLDLPPQEAKQAVANLEAEDLLVVRPGDAIRVDVQIHEEGFLAEEVKQILTQALAEAGMKVSDEAELTLVARMKNGETEKVLYHAFGMFDRQGEAIDVSNRVYELELQRNGAPIWRRESVHTAPHHLRLQQGETVREAIERAMRPTAANFRGRLPAYVVRPEYLEPLGTSKLSIN